MIGIATSSPAADLTVTATLLGFAFHTAALSQRWTEAGHFPAVGLRDGASFLAWATVLIFLLVYLATRVDVVFVLGGRNSSNTGQLARLCAATGVPTHHLETADELTREMLGEMSRVGVTAGASTPAWVVEQFIDRVKNLDSTD